MHYIRYEKPPNILLEILSGRDKYEN